MDFVFSELKDGAYILKIYINRYEQLKVKSLYSCRISFHQLPNILANIAFITGLKAREHDPALLNLLGNAQVTQRNMKQQFSNQKKASTLRTIVFLELKFTILARSMLALYQAQVDLAIQHKMGREILYGHSIVQSCGISVLHELNIFIF